MSHRRLSAVLTCFQSPWAPPPLACKEGPNHEGHS